MNINKHSVFLGSLLGFAIIFLAAYLLDVPADTLWNTGFILGGTFVLITILLYAVPKKDDS